MKKFESDKIEELLKSTKDDTVKSVLFNLKLVPTFSLIIDATFEPIQKFLHNEHPELSQDTITAIIVAAACQYIFNTYDRIKGYKDLRRVLKDSDLEVVVDDAESKLKKLLKIGGDVLKDVGYTTATLSGILGFAFILHPLMDGINKMLDRGPEYNIDNIFNYIVLGVAFKGSMFIEQFLKKLTREFEKDPKVKKIEKSEDNDGVDEFLSEEEMYALINRIL
jgi:hypothetical protein